MNANEARITKLMKSLGVTRDEAIAIIYDDDEVDSMSMKEVTSDLTAEQKKAVKNATKTTSKPREKVKRERKVDETKKRLINDYRVLLEGLGAKVEPLTTEAEMHFTFEGDSYTVKLIKHRPPKAPK